MPGRTGVGPGDLLALDRVPDGARVQGIGPNDFTDPLRYDVGGTDTPDPGLSNPEIRVIPPAGVVTFSTDFAGDGALSGDWTKQGGSGTIERVTGRAQATANGVAQYVAPTTGSPNHFAATDYVGALSYLIVRATNTTNYVGLRWSSDSAVMALISVASGVTTNHVQVAMPEPVGGRLELRIFNGRATGFLNGLPVPGMVSIDVSAVPTSNLCGIRANPSSVGVSDNFACGAISG